MKYKGKKYLISICTHIFLIVFAFLFNVPILSMVGTAFKGKKEAYTSTSLLTLHPKLSAFDSVLHTDFMKNIINSLIVSITVCIACIFLACLAGYALSRFKGKVFSLYAVMMLVLQMFPILLLLIPLFLIYKNLGLVNTYWSVIISYTCINLPFSVWMLRGFFDTISFDIEEAAMIDGCSQFQTMRKIIWPLSMPGIMTVAIFTFLNSWNEYTLASIFLKNEQFQTLTVGLQRFVMQNANNWAEMSAASTIATIPTLIFLLVAQKYLISGMTAGSMKG